MKTNFLTEFQKRTGICLNSVQQQAVYHVGKPLLLLACPGSGKTTTIITKIGYLIEEQQIDPNRIKAITFSKFSSQDMKKRYEQLFPHLPSVAFSTIHSLAFEIVRTILYQKQISYQLIEGNVQTNQLNKRTILKNIFKEKNGEYITEDQMEELITFISFLKNGLVPRQEWNKFGCKIPKVTEIIESYEQFKQSSTTNILLDFDDMLTIAYQSLKEDMQLREFYQQKFDFFLTDESQDTSKVQHKIVELLVQKHQNLCVVADDDQSIYRFRGADPSYLLNFKMIYPACDYLYMEQNYRSTKDIVTKTNDFIKVNTKRYKKEMFTENDWHQPIQIQNVENYVYQNRYVLEKIKNIPKEETVAILYRNHLMGIPFVNILDKEGINFSIKDSNQKFFQSWVVEDILNFMRLSFNDKKVDLFGRVALKMNTYLTKKQLQLLADKPNDQSCFDFFINHPHTKMYQLQPLKKAKNIIIELKKLSPLLAIEEIRSSLGYEKSIEKSAEIMGYQLDQLKSILNLLEEISDGLATLEDFAKRLTSLKQKISQASNAKSQLTLSTFHSSKGLEFDHVFIIDAMDGIIPSKEEKNDDELLAESARLFYVAMTRAKKHLEIITYKEKNMKKQTESEFVTRMKRLLSPTYFLENDLKTKRLEEGMLLEKMRNAQVITSSNEIVINQPIEHKVFGKGTVQQVDEELIEILFRSGVSKTLSLPLCLERQILFSISAKNK